MAEIENTIHLLEETNILERKVFWVIENKDHSFHKIFQNSMF